jgi:predicted CoA-substrate-specific enzyme activase
LIYAGCDLGMISAKVAIIQNSDILASEILPYESHPKQAAEEVMDKALAKVGLSREQINRCISTGFGKDAVSYANGTVPPLVCVHRAIRKLNPNIRTVMDVGGTSFRAFNTDDNGKVVELAVTDTCAVGTGMFLDVIANALEEPVEKLSRAALSSDNPIPISNTCVIFAESEVISSVNAGHDRLDIFAGVASGVAAKIVGHLTRIDVIEEVAMIGGVAKNSLVVRELEEKWGLSFANLGIDPQVIGALGAALIAKDEAEPASQ